MTIKVYSKPGCGKCESVKEKIVKLGFEYEEHSLQYHSEHHEGWRDDGSRELMAYLIAESKTGDISIMLPTIQIGNEYYDYSGATKKLKAMKKSLK